MKQTGGEDGSLNLDAETRIVLDYGPSCYQMETLLPLTYGSRAARVSLRPVLLGKAGFCPCS
jgi:hypothetical protein